MVFPVHAVRREQGIAPARPKIGIGHVHRHQLGPALGPGRRRGDSRSQERRAGGVALGAELNSAKCTASNGKSWIELSIGAGIGLGLGIEIDGNGRVVDRGRVGATRNPFTVASSVSTEVAPLLAFKKVGYSWAETEYTDFTDLENINGLGIGVAWITTKNILLNAKVIPLGTDQSKLYNQLIAEDKDSCDQLALRDSSDFVHRRDVQAMNQLAQLESEAGVSKQVDPSFDVSSRTSLSHLTKERAL